MELTFTIPDNQVSRLVEAINGIYDIPKTMDPYTQEWVPDYTPGTWAKERVRQFMIDTIRRYERKVAMDTARDTVSVNDNLVI